MQPGPGEWPGPDGSGGPHVFVADLESLHLDNEDRHHLEASLRLRQGECLTVSDGQGSWRACRFGAILTPDGEVQLVPKATPTLTIGFALTKGAKPELVVQKLTELGINRIVPFVAARSVTRWDDSKAAKQHVRLRRVARQAAMQSRQVRLPVVEGLATFDELLGPGAVRAERGGAPLTASHTTVLIGPEGGWAAGEAAALDEIGLGPHVLRAETATIAAATLMAGLRGTFW